MRVDWGELLRQIKETRAVVESIDAQVGDIHESDIPPCGSCGGKLQITHNARQGRWYAWCAKELRSHGHGETASEALKAHIQNFPTLTNP